MTDVVTPGINGLEPAQVLLDEYRNLRHMFVSGYTADVISHHGVLDEGVHFIQKPFTIAAVATTIREVLRGVAGSPPRGRLGRPARRPGAQAWTPRAW
jgi:FixJ family two-component response regulator